MDENAAPGYLSRIGLLAGVRAMLSPGAKDQQPQESDSPGRPVLRDMNTSGGPLSGGPKPKITLHPAQGLQGADGTSPLVSPDPLGENRLHSPSQWSEKGQRLSGASDTSFVSALSAVSKADRIDSDIDASSASDTYFDASYDSAVNTTTGSLSFLDDFAKLDLNSSSGDNLNNVTVVLADGQETDTVDNELSANVSVVSHQQTAGDKTFNQFDATYGSSFDATLEAGFDATYDAPDVNETDSVEAENKLDSTFEAGSENIDIAGEVESKLDSTFEAGSEKNDIAGEVESKLDSTFEAGSENINIAGEVESKLDITFEAIPQNTDIAVKTANKLDATFEASPENIDTAHDTQTAKNKSLSNLDATFEAQAADTDADLSEAQTAFSITANNLNASVDASPENVKDVNDAQAVITESQRNLQAVSTNANDSNETQTVVNGNPSNLNSSFEGALENVENVNEVQTGITDTPDIISDLSGAQTVVNDSPCDFDDGTSNVSVNGDVNSAVDHVSGSAFEETPLPVKVPRTFEEILAEQLEAEEKKSATSLKDTATAPVSNAFDEAPLPAKTPRTFEEILAEELKGQSLSGETAVPDIPMECGQEEEPHFEAAESKTADTSGFQSSCGSGDGPDECPQSEPTAEEHPIESSEGFDEVSIPVKDPRSFEEILEAELACHSDPEQAVPASTADEIPIPIKAPRTFEEILAAELAAQSDPESAVPSFTTSPGKLHESFNQITSAKTSPLESECEPDLVSDPTPLELESASATAPNNGLDSLIERCKQQEKELEQAEPDFSSVAAEASRLSLSFLNESHGASSTVSDCSEVNDVANQTVIMVEKETSPSGAPSVQKSKLDLSAEVRKVQVSSVEPLQGKPSEAEEFESGDAFAFNDPSAFDYLSLHGGTRSARDLRKESLYIKFDPLVGSLISDSRADSSFTMHPENSSENQTGATGIGEASPPADHNTTQSLVSFSPAPSKQAPQGNSEAGAPSTPVRTNSVKSTPIKTPAHVMLNETLESIGSRGTLVKQEDLIKKLQEHQTVLEQQDKAYQERIEELEQRLQEMEIQKADSLKQKDQELKDKDKQLEEKVQSLGELNVIMKEYEKTISRLVAEKSQEKAALEEKHVDLIKERDQAQQHLNNMEIAFSDIHTKYERLKSVVAAFKKNEETLNSALAEKQQSFDKMQNMYDMLKSHAVAKLEKANQDLEAIKQKHQLENAKLKAMIKKFEIKTKSLEEALEHKIKENQGLNAICEELINKVGE